MSGAYPPEHAELTPRDRLNYVIGAQGVLAEFLAEHGHPAMSKQAAHMLEQLRLAEQSLAAAEQAEAEWSIHCSCGDLYSGGLRREEAERITQRLRAEGHGDHSQTVRCVNYEPVAEFVVPAAWLSGPTVTVTFDAKVLGS